MVSDPLLSHMLFSMGASVMFAFVVPFVVHQVASSLHIPVLPVPLVAVAPFVHWVFYLCSTQIGWWHAMLAFVQQMKPLVLLL